MSIDVITILTATSSISGIVAIIIVIWDHIKDDRKLTKRVQKFYANIVNYIYLSYKLQKLRNTIIYISKQDIEKLSQIYASDFRLFQASYGHIMQNFDEYAKYLGIARYHGGIIVNNTQFQLILEREPSMSVMTIEDDEKTDIKRSIVPQRKNLIDDPRNITKGMTKDMVNFYDSLLNYWKEHYAKSVLKLIKIRPKLKPNDKLDFNVLLEGTDRLYKKK